MVRGFIPDLSYGAVAVSSWVEGVPEKSFWTGTKLGPDQIRVPTATFRCASCGYLESYASAEYAPR
jgi:hypothetical protein